MKNKNTVRPLETLSENRSRKTNRLRKLFLCGVVALFFGSVAGLGVAKADLPASGLVLQLDASTITGLADGTEVTSWAATVGGVSFTNYNDSSKPQYYSSIADLNGKAALYFDADCMTYSGTFGISGAADRTVIAVWADAVNTGSNYQHVLHMGNANSNQAYGLSVNRISNYGGDGSVSNHYWGSGFNATTKAGSAGNIAALVFASGTDNAYVNGWYGGRNTPATQNTATTTTLIGSRLNPNEGGGSMEGIKGYVAEVLVYDRALSSAEINQVSQYVVDKYGLSNVNTQSLRELSTTGAQIDLDFDTRSVTGGQFVGVQTDDGDTNKYLRLIDNNNNLNNYAYLTGANTGSDKITGSFDLRFTEATADGVSLVLAGSGVDITKNYGNSPNGETPSFAGSFGIGYTIYNKNQISVFWDGNQLGVINTADGSNYNLKGGNWFTTQFEIDYGDYGVGADVYVQLFDKTTNEAIGFFSTYVPSMSAANNQLLLRGRTGGSSAKADFDNIQILYSDLASGKTWIADKSGSFTDGANWDGGVAPVAGDTVYISGGTQTVSGGTLNLRNEVNLIVDGGTTTTGASGIAAGSTLVIRGGSLATTGSTNFRVGADGSGESYVADSGTATLTIGGGTFTADRWLSVGFNNDGVVNVYGGTLNASSSGQGIILGDRADATGTLNQYGGTVQVAGTLSVGPTGTGVVNVEAGTLNAKVISMGDGEFNISGGTVNATGSGNGFQLGAVADKTSTVNQTGGTVNVSDRLSIGSIAGSTGVYNLSGNGALKVSQYLFIGNLGNGTLNVDGARVDANVIIMGEQKAASEGILNIKNSGQVWMTGYFEVGDKPGTKGTVNISSGSQLRINSVDFRIGGNEGDSTTSGTVNLSGGSLLTSKGLYTNGGGKGAAATVKMDNTSWAIISANSYALTFDSIKTDYDKGMLYVGTSADDIGILSHGTGAILLPGLTINSGSTATINAGMAINSDSSITPNTSEFYIGYTTDSANNKIVVNEGGILNTNQTISMGRDAGSFGELDIYGSMTATGTYLLMGFKGQGKIVIDGANASLTAKNTIIGDNTGVAEGKTCGGTIDILNGGKATLDRLSIGDKSTANGAVTVSGGSTLAVGANNFFVGNAGDGSLAVKGGSTVTAGAGITIGNTANSGKTAEMSVTDSTVTVSGDLTAGQVSGSTGTLVIEGNSKVTSTGTLFAGKAGVGNVTLSGNAQVSAATFFQSHDGSSSAGAFTIKDNATLSVTGSHLIFSRNSSGVATLKDNATINFSGTGVLGLDEQGGAGVLNIEGGTLNAIKPGNQGGFAIWNSGKVVQTGGVVNLGTVGTDTTNLILKSANAKYELSGGTLNVTGALIDSSGGNGKNFAFSGGTLSANNINFDLTQTGGVLSPGINWDNTEMAVGTTTINGTYTLAGADALTPAALLLEIDFANNTADQIIVNAGGSLVFGDNSAINLAYDESMLKGGASFDLFAGAGAVDLESVISMLSARDQYIWDVFTNGSGGITFQVDSAAVPEPSTWALLILGAAGLACIRKRRAPGR